MTGEIDTETLTALQQPESVASTAPVPPPPARSENKPTSPKPADVEAKPVATDSAVQQDRAFLERIETGRESVPSSPTVAAAVPDQSVNADGADAEAVAPKPRTDRLAVVQNTSTRVAEVEATPPAALASVEAGPAVILKSRQTQQPVAAKPRERAEKPRKPASNLRIVEYDNTAEPLDPNGARILKPFVATSQPDSRVASVERKSAATPASNVVIGEPVEIRRAEPVEPRQHKGFFHRLFKDNGDDN